MKYTNEDILTMIRGSRSLGATSKDILEEVIRMLKTTSEPQGFSLDELCEEVDRCTKDGTNPTIPEPKRTYMCVRCEQIFSKHSQLGLHLDKNGNPCYKPTPSEPIKLAKIEKLGIMPDSHYLALDSLWDGMGEIIDWSHHVNQLLKEGR